MKANVIISLAAAVLVILVLAGDVDGESAHAAEIIPALPASLDSFYPPIADAPLYLLQMHELGKAFSGVGSDAAEGDIVNARSNYEAFRQAYLKLTGMVPEWSSLLPLAPVDALGKAVESGAAESIMASFGGVGAVCHDCHRASMAPAQHKYHWDDFHRISLSDPITRTDLSFQRLMQLVESDMTGIAIDLQQGQIDNARAHAKNFRTRYAILKQTCTACHDTERHYYVDSSWSPLSEPSMRDWRKRRRMLG